MNIKCKEIFKKFKNCNERGVLNGVSFELDSGNSLSISGPSGVGKSTLLNILAGLDKPDRGEIFFNDICFTNLSNTKKTLFRLNNISHIFQAPNLLQDFNVIENIMLPLRYRGTNSQKSRNIAIECLDEANLLEHQDSPVSILSGGEAQRVGIARAIAMKSKIIFADEPTGNLDSVNSQSVINKLTEICETHMITLIVVSHDDDVIHKMKTKKKMLEGKVI
tara:strand:+ start:646 stop:1308 length:663 start_codon:yes stop_codon:yes gene_type:complete